MKAGEGWRNKERGNMTLQADGCLSVCLSVWQRVCSNWSWYFRCEHCVLLRGMLPWFCMPFQSTSNMDTWDASASARSCHDPHTNLADRKQTIVSRDNVRRQDVLVVACTSKTGCDRRYTSTTGRNTAERLEKIKVRNRCCKVWWRKGGVKDVEKIIKRIWMKKFSSLNWIH